MPNRKPNGYWNNKQNCEEMCKKCSGMKDLKKKSYACYLSIKKHKWVNDFFKITARPMGYWNNKNNCKKECIKYKTAYELQRNCYGCYCGIKRNGWLYEFYPLKDGTKPMGYWKDKKSVIKEGLKYKNKTDFKNNSGGAYNSAIRNGWMSEIETNFVKKAKYHDKNEKIHYVYVYKFPEFKTCYVGRTLDLHKRDLSHRRGRKHKNGTITYDSVYEFANKNKLSIPLPIILYKNLTAEESLIKEDEMVKKYSNDGWSLLNKAKTGRLSGSLGSFKKWDYEACKKFCKKYQFKSEIMKANSECYEICRKNGWFDGFGIKNKNKQWINKETCLNEAKKYKNKSEFIINSIGAYSSIKKHGWIDELNKIFKKD